MKRFSSTHQNPADGFALIATVTVMTLLVLVALSMLSLSTITTRSSSISSAETEARTNAKLALMIAIGELQKEMGPDMRISAESAILDNNETTEIIDGVVHSRWLASYDSWGNWLNASYTRPGDSNSLDIADTYSKGRNQMFRRWMLSLPEDYVSEPSMPLLGLSQLNALDGFDADRLMVMVGEGSLGAKAGTHPDQVTRAYRIPIGFDENENGTLDDEEITGSHAWWIGPENHKAKVTLSKNPRNLAVSEWETSQGDTAEIAVGALDGFDFLESLPATSDRLITQDTLNPAGANNEDLKGHFFDLTASSEGVIASVRSGHLKKDLSLLFERPNSGLPDLYRYNSGDVREPSIRPMSPELSAKNPQTPNRHFASWTSMRHFYRMYRQDSDAESPVWTNGGTSGAPALNWTGSNPWTDVVTTSNCFSNSSTDWDGKNSYLRVPVLIKLTFIHSVLAEYAGMNSSNEEQYRLYLVYTPVYTYWNPYNTELHIPDGALAVLSSAYKALPMEGSLYLNGNRDRDFHIYVSNTWSQLRTRNGTEHIFKPGELKVFSHDSINGGVFGDTMYPGFDPQAYGGQKVGIPGGMYTKGQSPAVALRFSNSVWGGNVNHGNTPGSLDVVQDWAPEGAGSRKRMALNYQIDWFNVGQTFTPITVENQPQPWIFDDAPNPVGYTQLTVKGLSEYNYESIDWAADWRSRNWIQSPPFYFGHGLYISEDDTIGHTQRMNNPYVVNFGPMTNFEMPKVVFHNGPSAFLGSGASPYEKVNAVSSIELPSAPISSLAGFSGMRIKPGWTEFTTINPEWKEQGGSWHNTGDRSLYGAEVKALSYQSGITGPGIGNSFMHPVLSRDDVYQFFNNSVSMDPINRGDLTQGYSPTDTKAFSDFWDHVFLLNDTLWDDYFVSSLADQTRPGASSAVSLDENLDQLVQNEAIANSRYHYYQTGESSNAVKTQLQAQDGYLKAARHLMVDGSFNVNSTSVDAWYALFAGIRERTLVYRDSNGSLQPVDIPSGKRIALSRFNTEVTNLEMDEPDDGASLPDGRQMWSGVRFLDDDQLLTLAEECVKQVKLRGPFLNYAEFINRRLSNDDLGLMGALQSAIDYDDANPDSDSINYRFKNGPGFMISESDLGDHALTTPEAAVGSRFAGIPGYVIQSDILKPLGNTLSVRDDTFRIRAYGESVDRNGNVVARAWCEAIVQRIPEYSDSANEDHVAARTLDAQGNFIDNSELTDINRLYGRKFRIKSFRWLSSEEV